MKREILKSAKSKCSDTIGKNIEAGNHNIAVNLNNVLSKVERKVLLEDFYMDVALPDEISIPVGVTFVCGSTWSGMTTK